MNINCSLAAAVVLGGSLIASATAQPPSPPRGDGTITTAITVPAGSLQKTHDAWRGRMLIGTPVFNDNGQQIATINDLLITDNGVVDRVVLSVRRRQLVAIPFSQFRLVPSQSIGRHLGRRGRRFTGIGTTAFGLFGVMLPGASRDSLASMEEFRFVPPP
jgi:PRC-barrel domain